LRFSIGILLRMVLVVITVILLTSVMATLLVLVCLFTSSSVPGYWVMVIWSRGVAASMGLTFSIKGLEKLVPGVSYIVTPNHQGNTDILALVCLLPMKFHWVVKRELLRIPFFGAAVRRTGAIAVDRSDKRQAVKSLQTGSGRLREGWSILIYPEGTRTSDGKLQPFKKGAFMTAVQTGLPILPITCNGAFEVMPKNTLMVRPGHITLTVSDPISTDGLSEDDVPKLMEQTREAISKNLNPDYDPFADRHK
jgi:1-acyl-sn-glycerol-3-phosphate acyltransferase